MKKFLWILPALVVVAYCVNSDLENKAARETEKVEAKAEAAKIEAAVSKMVARTEAIDDWVSQLSDMPKNGMVDPAKTEAIDDWASQLSVRILTIELERLLVRPRPILFKGAIKDIFTVDPSRYMVLIERDISIGHKLQLSLISSKENIDSFLDKHPDLFRNYGRNNSVAVVARIHSIRSPIRPRTVVYPSDDESNYDNDDDDEVKVGDGELIDIAFLGCHSDWFRLETGGC